MVSRYVIVLRAPGTNCDEETSFAWEQAGACVERLHVKRLIERPNLLDGCQILTIPGGFSYGDDIAGGQVLANQLAHHLGDAIRRFLDGGGLILGICNGFQVLVRMGLLPGPGGDTATSLMLNDSGRYEDRWVRVRAEVSHCPFLEEGRHYELPVAHAEGKVVTEDGAAGAGRLAAATRIALRYVDRGGKPAGWPANPNGSVNNVAGLTDSTGRILGLMPHPERHILRTHAPDWKGVTSPGRGGSGECDGRLIFRRALSSLG